MILLVFLALILYYSGRKVGAILLYFFFVTDSFQIIPDNLLSSLCLGLKSTDYAILMMFLIIGINILLKKESIFSKFRVWEWGIAFLFLSSAFLSYFVYHIPASDIIKTTRVYLLFFSSFLFFDLDNDDYLSLKKILLYITLVESILFAVQSFSYLKILNGYAGGTILSFLGMKIGRFYNLPYLVYYFFFDVFFDNDLSIKKKVSYMAILSLPIILCMHRSLILVVLFCLFSLILLKGPSLSSKIRKVLIGCLVIFPLYSLSQSYLAQRGGISDFKSIMNGDYIDVDYVEDVWDQTFLFRVTHLYERYNYISQDPMHLLFGAGWMHESSTYTARNFDFKIGLKDDSGNITQLDTADIAWSLFLIRFGIVGTIIYLFLLCRMAWFLYKKNAIASFATLFLMLLNSFTGVMIFLPSFFVIILMDRVHYGKLDEQPLMNDEVVNTILLKNS